MIDYTSWVKKEMSRLVEEVLMNPCLICGKSDDKKPMCFRGEQWCCELHRKRIHEIPFERVLPGTKEVR